MPVVGANTFNISSACQCLELFDHVIQEEAARGFDTSGFYRKRLRYFVDGLVIGSEGFIRKHLDKLRDDGHYAKRKHPIPQLEGIHLPLREQRSTAVYSLR